MARVIVIVLPALPVRPFVEHRFDIRLGEARQIDVPYDDAVVQHLHPHAQNLTYLNSAVAI